MSGSSHRAAIHPDSPPPASFQSSIPNVPPGLRLGPQSVELSCCAPHTRYGKWFVVITWYICAVAKSSSVHVRPPSVVTSAPPSSASIIRLLSLGLIHRSCESPWRMLPTGRNVFPPSVERWKETLLT